MRDIVRFCAQECARQHSGELSVFWMYDAWDYARCCHGVNDRLILCLGLCVEPVKNKNGYRRIPVSFRNGTVNTLTSEQITRQVDLLCQCVTDPVEFYQHFEEIHPFVDGNGRVGAILYNMLNGTLLEPVTPPAYKE